MNKSYISPKLKQIKAYKETGVVVGYGHIPGIGKRYMVGLGGNAKRLANTGGKLFTKKSSALISAKRENSNRVKLNLVWEKFRKEAW
jgi:hypothetical protein